MGSHDLRRKAQSFLDAAKGEADNNKITAELQKRDDEIALLKNQMQHNSLKQTNAKAKAKE